MNNMKSSGRQQAAGIFCLNIGNAFDLLFWYVYTI